MNEREADDGKEDRCHQSYEKRFRPDPAHGAEPRIESDSGHSDENEKFSQFIDLLNGPLPLIGREERGSVSDGPDDCQGQESEEKRGNRF